jgi:hypothetical protein
MQFSRTVLNVLNLMNNARGQRVLDCLFICSRILYIYILKQIHHHLTMSQLFIYHIYERVINSTVNVSLYGNICSNVSRSYIKISWYNVCSGLYIFWNWRSSLNMCIYISIICRSFYRWRKRKCFYEENSVETIVAFFVVRFRSPSYCTVSYCTCLTRVIAHPAPLHKTRKNITHVVFLRPSTAAPVWVPMADLPLWECPPPCWWGTQTAADLAGHPYALQCT